MRRVLFIVATLVAIALPQSAFASRLESSEVENFGPNLQAECPNPEGIAVDPKGNLYAASFAFQPEANICVISDDGDLVDKISVSHGSAPVTSLLGELFVPGQGLYVVDFADGVAPHGRLLRVDPVTRVVTTITAGFAAPNGIARDRAGNLFVSDSFLGQIVRVRPDGSRRTVWKDDERLRTKGQPPFGANGVAFDRNQGFLYVANTGDSRVLRIPVDPADGSAGEIEIFADGATINARQGTAEALHGADGIMFDVKGNLYVCANQANEIQVIAPDGSLVVRHRGLEENALDFPASLVFFEDQLFITNLSLATGVNSKLSVLDVPFPGLPI